METLAAVLPEVAGDPFCDDEIARPGRIDAAIREAGEIVALPAHGVVATGRHEAARAILRDWRTFTSTGGTGLPDIRTDPWRTTAPGRC